MQSVWDSIQLSPAQQSLLVQLELSSETLHNPVRPQDDSHLHPSVIEDEKQECVGEIQMDDVAKVLPQTEQQELFRYRLWLEVQRELVCAVQSHIQGVLEGVNTLGDLHTQIKVINNEIRSECQSLLLQRVSLHL